MVISGTFLNGSRTAGHEVSCWECPGIPGQLASMSVVPKIQLFLSAL